MAEGNTTSSFQLLHDDDDDDGGRPAGSSTRVILGNNTTLRNAAWTALNTRRPARFSSTGVRKDDHYQSPGLFCHLLHLDRPFNFVGLLDAGSAAALAPARSFIPIIIRND